MKTSIRQFLASLAGASVYGLLSSLAHAAPIAWDVTVYTVPFAGSNGFLDFQLNYGVASAPQASVTISNFTPIGMLQGAPILDGGATGSLPTGATIVNAGAFNGIYQSVLIGTGFTFRIAFDGAFISSPSHDGTTFSFNLLDATGANPLGLANPSGNALTAQLINGDVDLRSDGNIVGNDTFIRFKFVPATNNVPAPSILVLLVLGCLAVRRMR